MAVKHKTPEDITNVINDNLRKELEELELHLNHINEDIAEYMQLDKSIEFIKAHKPNGYKTKVDIGTNMFMLANVEKIEPILINIGLNTYLELELEEASKFLKMKIKALNNEAEVLRERSLKVRADIKVLLLYLAEIQNMHSVD
jgi:prefoldin alpha subunit